VGERGEQEEGEGEEGKVNVSSSRRDKGSSVMMSCVQEDERIERRGMGKPQGSLLDTSHRPAATVQPGVSW
jgi:hypothetical protein